MAKITKAHYICTLLAAHGPMTRDKLTRGAWVMEGAKIPYKVTSNGCYFLSGTQGGGNSPYGGNVARYKSSLLRKGLIKVVGRQGRKFLYDLTPAGKALAATITTI
jgi:hypothetical protein